MGYLSLQRHSKLRYPLRIWNMTEVVFSTFVPSEIRMRTNCWQGPTASSACSIKAFAQSAVIASLHVPNEVPMFSPGNLAAADILVKKRAQAPKLELATFAVKLKPWGEPR